MKKRVIKFFKGIEFYAPILFVPVLIYFGQSWGVVGILLAYLGWAVYRVYKVRDTVKEQVSYLETLLYGKPLKKEFWTKEEQEAFKNAKFRDKYKFAYKHKRK